MARKAVADHEDVLAVTKSPGDAAELAAALETSAHIERSLGQSASACSQGRRAVGLLAPITRSPASEEIYRRVRAMNAVCDQPLRSGQ